VGLERGPLSLVSTTEELLDKKSSGSCLENREYGRRDPSRRPRGTLYPQKLAITWPTSGGRSVGVVRSRTQTMEVFFFYRFRVFLPPPPLKKQRMPQTRAATGSCVRIAHCYWGKWPDDAALGTRATQGTLRRQTKQPLFRLCVALWEGP
jgi:hypothetical protein